MSELSSRYVHREITLLCLWHSNTCQHTNHISRICLITAMRNSPRRRRKHRPHRPLWVLLYHSPIYQSVWCRVHAMAATWLHFHVAKIEKGFTARCFVLLFPVLTYSGQPHSPPPSQTAGRTSAAPVPALSAQKPQGNQDSSDDDISSDDDDSVDESDKHYVSRK